MGQVILFPETPQAIADKAQPGPRPPISKAPEPASPEPYNGPSYDRTHGDRYDRSLSPKDISAILRREIKAETKAGALPAGLKVSVRTRHYNSIDITVTAYPGNPISPGWALHTRRHGFRHDYRGPRYTPRARALLAHLKSKAEAFNYDGSDLMSDYFDVNFYLSVDIAHEVEEPAREAAADWAEAELAAGRVAWKDEDGLAAVHPCLEVGQDELAFISADGTAGRVVFTPQGYQRAELTPGPDLPTPAHGLDWRVDMPVGHMGHGLPELDAWRRGDDAGPWRLAVKTWPGAPWPDGFQPPAPQPAPKPPKPRASQNEPPAGPAAQEIGHGLTVTATMTTPTRPGKKPRPVWEVRGETKPHAATLRELGGRYFRGAWSFFSDPAQAIAAALDGEPAPAPADAPEPQPSPVGSGQPVGSDRPRALQLPALPMPRLVPELAAPLPAPEPAPEVVEPEPQAAPEPEPTPEPETDTRRRSRPYEPLEHDLMPPQTLRDMVAAYEKAYAEMAEGVARIAAGVRIMTRLGIQDYNCFPDRFGRYDLAPDKMDDTQAELRKVLKNACWRELLERGKLTALLSQKRKAALADQISADKTPDFTFENVWAMFQGMGQDWAKYLQEAAQEVYDWLRPPLWNEYKTNQKYEIGPKVIKTCCVARWGGRFRIGTYRHDNLADLDKVFHLLDGAGAPKYPGDLVTSITEAMQSGHMETETDYFRVKWFKNGNMHIEFKRLDILAQLNAKCGGPNIRHDED